jgi:hypothetical protein
MNSRVKRLLFCLLLLTSNLALANKLRPFTSDGCSKFPDGTPENPTAWRQCCIQHDILYWKGGTQGERSAADRGLYECVSRAGYPETAALMYAGVRVGGSPFVKTPWRWGYGWQDLRGYSALNAEEQQQVQSFQRSFSLPVQIVLQSVSSEENTRRARNYCLKNAVAQMTLKIKNKISGIQAYQIEGDNYRLQIFSKNCQNGYFISEFGDDVNPKQCLDPRARVEPKTLTAYGDCAGN